MNERIETLIKELMDVCEEEGVNVSLCALTSKGEAALAQCGDQDLIALATTEQFDKCKQELEENDCDCLKHTLLKSLFNITTEPEPEPERDPFSEKLDAFLRGEFR